MNATQRRHRLLSVLLLTFAGCGGTIASVRVPSLPEPPPSKFESFDDWDRRVNPATTQATTQPATAPAPL